MFALKGRRGVNPQRQGIFRESPQQIKMREAKSKLKSKQPQPQYKFNSHVKPQPQPQVTQSSVPHSHNDNNNNNVKASNTQSNGENIALTEAKNKELLLQERQRQIMERDKVKLLKKKTEILENNALEKSRQNDIKNNRRLEIERSKMYDDIHREKLENERIVKQKKEKRKYEDELILRKLQLEKKSNRRKELIKENEQKISKPTANNLSKAIKLSQPTK